MSNFVRAVIKAELGRLSYLSSDEKKALGIQTKMEVADLRGRAIVSMLALGGFRVGTLCRLKYRHVRDDLERGVIPVHVRVEAEITKGKYGEYDTFLGREVADALNLYFDQRRRGKLYSHRTAEQIEAESPLLRNEQSNEVKSLTAGALHRIVHDLFIKAGLLSHDIRTRYVLRPHSIRKFFRTQLAALGVNTDYIEYMMGHKVNTYHDVKMIGIEKLRQIYARSGLSVRPKAPSDKLEMLKEFTRSLGLDPEKIIIRDALAEPHRAIAIATDDERAQFAALGEALKEWIKREASNAHSEQEKRYTSQK